MSNESENKLARRVDDKRADVPLEWNEAANANTAAAAAPALREVLEYTGLDALARVFADAANTSCQVVLSPQSCDLLYRAMTTPLATPVAPAVPAPSQVPAELTDERIKEIARKAVANRELSWSGFEEDANGFYTVPVLSKMHFDFARAIERELRAGSRCAQPELDQLHNAIMNLPCRRTMSHFASNNEMHAYKVGHRDARHAAAELVNGFELRAGSSDVRDQALEEAAKVCLAKLEIRAAHGFAREASTARQLAEEIRALKSAAPAASKEGGASHG